MTVPSAAGSAQRRRFGVARWAAHALSLALLWGILSGGEGWHVGAPLIFVAAAASCMSMPTSRWSVWGLARFLPYFFWHSLRAGIDVAFRALHPALPIDPAIVRYDLHLDSNEARVLMADTVTLLPGTLSVDLEENVLLVHVLNASAPVMDMLGTLERRIGNLVLEEHLARRE